MKTVVPKFYAKDRSAWRTWLTRHAEDEAAVWVVFDKGKNRTLSYDDIVEEAVCYGWIDSKPGKVSDTRSKLYISKRRPSSAWSKSNKERVAKLRAAKLMTPAGEAAIKIAKQNGSWDKLNQSDKFVEPTELRLALDQKQSARIFYDGMSASSKRIILEWIYDAKTHETKMKRIRETVELAAKGIKAHHYRQ